MSRDPSPSARDVACPDCGARAGESCRPRSASIGFAFHAGRIAACASEDRPRRG